MMMRFLRFCGSSRWFIVSYRYSIFFWYCVCSDVKFASRIETLPKMVATTTLPSRMATMAYAVSPRVFGKISSPESSSIDV